MGKVDASRVLMQVFGIEKKYVVRIIMKGECTGIECKYDPWIVRMEVYCLDSG